MAVLLLGSLSAHAGGFEDARYRVAVADDRFSGTTQVAAAFDVRQWRRWGADWLRFEVGVFEDGENTRPFLSLGPVWHRPLGQSRYFTELSISPTLIAGSTFQGEELGGDFHFTSALVFGTRVGGRGVVALRLQHTSNGGIRETNPGMDMLGITFSFVGH
ncbi:MAG TPA: acyloxyacyl hydrolase [Woeseiaceae bacterium]|nr:acyloxyacyl hydrolase [Woeseiaceae bacterium]